MGEQRGFVGPEEAVGLVKSGDVVVFGEMAAEPRVLVAALAARADSLRDVKLLSGMLLSDYPFLRPELAASFQYRTWFMPGTITKRNLAGANVAYLPLTWGQTTRFLYSTTLDVAMVQVSPADSRGYHSLGIGVGHALPAVRTARIVLAEVNPWMPRTLGASLVHESEIDAKVAVDYRLPAFPVRRADPIDTRVASNAAELIPNGSTVQPGLGAIPEEVMRALGEKGRRGLRIHSMLTDSSIDLFRLGCMEGKPAARAGEIVGSQLVYDFVHENELVEMIDGLQTHGRDQLLQVPNFVSVNSALEVDLFGQANLELLGGAQVGGIGGSLDFLQAADFGENRSILALRATTTGGDKSRIVPCLGPGPVSVGRTMTQYVVTEYGVADLRYKSVGERAEALVAVAHPDFRSQLRQAFRDLPAARGAWPDGG